jgi:hypothetical protein
LVAACLRGLSEGEGTGCQAVGQSQDERRFYGFAWTSVWCGCRQRVFGTMPTVANIACDKLGFGGRGRDWLWREFDGWE